MNLKECYIRLGGSFDDILARFRREETVRKFILKFLDDGSFSLLEKSLADQNREEAFRAAHTLKGICQNLSFTKLFESSQEMTEALRGATCKKRANCYPKCAGIMSEPRKLSGLIKSRRRLQSNEWRDDGKKQNHKISDYRICLSCCVQCDCFRNTRNLHK